MKIKQSYRTERFYCGDTNVRVCQEIDNASWIWYPGHNRWYTEAEKNNGYATSTVEFEPIPVFRFRREFQSDGTPLLLDVSADERYVLFLDGEVVSRGPHRGTVEHWYYQSYEIDGLSEGNHLLEAVCWQLSGKAPLAQLSMRGGFILKAEGFYDEQLTTGKAPWQAAPLTNLSMSGTGTSQTFGVGTECQIRGTSFLNETPEADAWRDAEVIRGPINSYGYGLRYKAWMLFPTQRPDMLHNSCTPGRVVNTDFDLKHPTEIPPNTRLDLYWNLDNYYCAYPELRVSGGQDAVVTWGWAESLVGKDGRKGNRDEWQEKEFTHTLTDTFLCDGRTDAFFTTPWWRCGKWCRITIQTKDSPLLVQKISIAETRYPLEIESSFKCDLPEITAVSQICERTIQMCMHEMMFDCPYYEQQMYPGDTRIELNILNALTHDARMHHFVMGLFNGNRRDNGMVPMNYPTRCTQESTTYTMCWILMFNDYLMWHDDAEFLKAQMPGVCNSMMGLERYENADGLLENLPGWSFMDWVDGVFDKGIAPNGDVGTGVSSLNNLLYLLTMRAFVAVEETLGETHLAARWKEKSTVLSKKIVERFWDEGRGMVADTFAHDCFSEHAQCLAILAECLSEEQRTRAFNGLISAGNLAPVSTYFAYYLFEAYTKCGRADLVFSRLEDWRNFLKWGANTAFETQHIDSRSDCHAWSASPLYFYHTAFAGVTPDKPFFGHVRIAPQPAGMTRIASKTPCPQGFIETEMSFDSGKLSAKITLPGTLEGAFVWKDKCVNLKPGETTLEFPL